MADDNPATRPGAPILWRWIAGGLAAAAVVCAIPLGCTAPWPRLALEAVVTVAVVACALNSGARMGRAVLIPPALGLLFAVQLLPLPDQLLMSLSPLAASAWQVAHAGGAAAWGTLSVEPAATAAAIRRLVLGASLVVTVSALAADMRCRRLLLGGLAVAAAVIIGLGLLFPVNPARRVLLGFVPLYGPLGFWQDPTLSPVQTSGWGYLEWVTVGNQRYLLDIGAPGDGFGSYISTNQFASGVYLTLPILLGVALHWLSRRLPRWLAFVPVFAGIGGAAWIIAALTGSRAGTLALAMSALALVWLTAERSWLRRLLAITTAAFAIGFVAFVVVLLGNVESVDRLAPEAWQAAIATVRHDGRIVATDTALRMFQAAPIPGLGLGTYGDLYPRFVRAMSTWHYAHNDYTQFLGEGGCLGAVVMLTGVAIVAGAFRRWLPGARGPERVLDAGPWAALAGLAVHSAFDWNLHLPANAFLACVVTGLCLASGRRAPELRGTRAEHAASWLSIVPPTTLAIVCLGCLAFLVRDARSDSAQRQMRLALVEETKASRDPDYPPARHVLEQAVNAGRAAARWDPANSGLALLNGHVCLHLAELTTARTRAAFSDEAEQWFLRAQRTCAVQRGLPEPLPKPAPPRR